jgi:hypothetical protein
VAEKDVPVERQIAEADGSDVTEGAVLIVSAAPDEVAVGEQVPLTTQR